MQIQWAYFRPGCQSCIKAQAILAKHGLEPATTQNAKKEVIAADEAVALARKAKKVIASKGTKVVSVDLAKDKPDDETLRSLVVGPSGNLRAPTLKIGRDLIVGFSDALYAQVFANGTS